jgi:sugar/nucleoside kinase (ribokinase family)
MSEHAPREIMEEILWYQENSHRLAADESPDYAESRKPVETTTISVRLPKPAAEQITRMAQERGWTVSMLVRSWIQQGSSRETPSEMRSALHEFEASYAKLRRAINTAT